MVTGKHRFFTLILVAFITLPSWQLRPAAARGSPQAFPEPLIQPAPDLAPRMDLLLSGDQGVVLDVFVPGYQVSASSYQGQVYDALEVKGALQSQVGEFQLPVLSYLVGIPADAAPELEVNLLDSLPLPGSYSLAPAASFAEPLVEDGSANTAYQDAPQVNYAPAMGANQPARLGEPAWLRDQRLISIEVFPFQASPGGGLIWNRHLRIALKFQPGISLPLDCLPCLEELGSKPLQPAQKASLAGLSDSPFEAALRGGLINYEAARQGRGFPESRAAAPNLTPGQTYYRIPIDQDGLYRLSYESLQAAGLDVSGLDPTLLHLTSQGQEVARHLYENDGDLHHFSPGEYIAFYGQKLYGDRLASLYADEDSQWLSFVTQDTLGNYISWTPEYSAAQVEKYTDQNIYWLYLADDPGLEMPALSGFPGGAPLAQTYRETQREERQIYRVANQSWTLVSGVENWFWTENYTSDPNGVNWTYTTSLSSLASGDHTATVRAEVISTNSNDSYSPDHHTSFYLNDPSHLQPLDDKTWDGKSRYRFETSIDQSRLQEGENRLDLVAYKTSMMESDTLYFDWFEIEYEREFQAQGDKLAFSTPQAGEWRYHIGGFTTSDMGVLQITDPLTPTWVSDALWNSGSLDFQWDAPAGELLYVGKMIPLAAADIQAYTPPDLSASADYLIISHADFLESAQRLVDYRKSRGMTTRLVDVADLYNQFNYGIFNPIAIKNYLRYTFQNWETPPYYALLIGDGHWNFKGSARYNAPPNWMPPNLAWIDPWYGELDATSLLGDVVGDDPLPDVSIGRMTARTAGELDAMIDKTIAYESAPRQDWQRRFTFVVDNVPDPAGDFVGISNRLIEDYSQPGFALDKIYENDFNCPFNNDCPQVTTAITQALNITGTLLLNYTGHGSINRWSGESIFLNWDIGALENGDRLPVVLSMTCNDGFWNHPGVAPNSLESLMEEMLRALDKGMAASFSPTGFGVSTGHDSLHRGFYEAILHEGAWGLSQAVASARLRLFATGSNLDLLHTFTIFGDPALQIPSPYDLAFGPAEDSGYGPPGASVDYSFTLTNTGALTDTFAFQMGDTAWPVVLPPSLTLPAGASAPITLAVNIPSEAQDGDSDQVSLLAASLGDSSKKNGFQVTTTAQDYGVLLLAEPSSQTGMPGEVVTYQVQVYNNGAYEDSYDLSLLPGAWSVMPIPTKAGPLLPGESQSFAVSVHIPAEGLRASSDATVVTAASQERPARTDSLTLTTYFNRVFLPAIVRDTSY